MKKEILISRSKNGMAQYVIHHYQEGLKNRCGKPYRTSITVHKRYSGDPNSESKTKETHD